MWTELSDTAILNKLGTRLKAFRISIGLKQQELQIILDTLIECHGNRQMVSDKLGISPRTLRYKIAKMREMGMIIPG